MKTYYFLLLSAALVLGACAPMDQIGSVTGGKPVDHDMGNHVHCYTYTQGSLSCIQVQ